MDIRFRAVRTPKKAPGSAPTVLVSHSTEGTEIVGMLPDDETAAAPAEPGEPAPVVPLFPLK